MHLIARGNTIMNIVNGHVTAFIVDDDAKGRAMKGLLGFQIHVGDADEDRVPEYLPEDSLTKERTRT